MSRKEAKEAVLHSINAYSVHKLNTDTRSVPVLTKASKKIKGFQLFSNLPTSKNFTLYRPNMTYFCFADLSTYIVGVYVVYV